MKLVPLSMVCAIVALTSPADAVDPKTGATPATMTQHLPVLKPTVEKRMAIHAGRRGVPSTASTEPKKTKQEIADEKKLQQDMHICDGC